MKRYITIAVILLLMPLIAGAQALKGSYFMDNSVNRHRMNPAFTPRSNYFQLPMLGTMGFGMVTNLDAQSFLYPQNGELLTFLHPDVSFEQFEKNFPKHPHFDVDYNTNLLSFGFFTKQHSYWTFNLDIRTIFDVDLPSDLFYFIKKGTGTQSQSMNIANFNMYGSASVQASLGYSRDIIDGLRVGVKVRAIAPMAYAGLNLENVRLNTSKEKWNITTEGYLDIALNGLQMEQTEDMMPSAEFDLNRMLSNKVLAGFGYSFDLGAEYRWEREGFFNGVRASVAVTDLGSIRYKKNAVSRFSTTGSVDWTGVGEIDSMDDEQLQAALDKVTEDMQGLVNLKQEESKSFSRSTMPNFYAGLEVPFMWNRMSVGLLYSGRLSHSYMRNELTASFNLKALKWLSLGVNYSFLNTSGTLGWMLELTPKSGLSFFIGGDYLPLAWLEAPLLEDSLDWEGFLGEDLANSVGLSSGMMPMSMRLNLHFGISVVMGSKYGR